MEPLRHELRAAARAAHGTAGEPRRVTVTSIFVSNEQREHTAQREALRATSEEEARPVLRRLEERLAAVEARLDHGPSSGESAP